MKLKYTSLLKIFCFPSFAFTTFISRATLEQVHLNPNDQEEWNNTNSANQVLVKLLPGTTAAAAQKGILGVFNKYHKQEKYDCKQDMRGARKDIFCLKL